MGIKKERKKERKNIGKERTLEIKRENEVGK